MLNKLKDKLEQAAEEARASVRRIEEAFDDPLARQTDWRPANRGGTNTRSRTLKAVSPERLAFKAAAGPLLIAGAAVATGAFLALKSFFAAGGTVSTEVFIGGSIAAVGLLLGYWFTRPIVLDKQTGLCWKGHRAPKSESAARDQANAAVLSDVGAVQVIGERVSGSKGRSYRSFEINLVLRDGSRLNLVDHAKQEAIRADAQRLGEFLGVPVWDASGLS
ncbi:MAG: hypothetical protein U5Q16_15550 [Gammaproteobacteria bacterium]|nr:hypothetical protein [Gammaproteobacteria bacterium]